VCVGPVTAVNNVDRPVTEVFLGGRVSQNLTDAGDSV